MRHLRLALALLLALTAFPAGAAAARAAADYYVMRHLQKGAGEDPPLSPEGAIQAERLARWFGARPPRAIYVSATRRARETSAALARRLGLRPIEYDPRDTAALVARLKRERGTVLVVGHSNTVPDIIAALGGQRPAPLGDSDYGQIWHVVPNGRTEMKRLHP